MEIMLCLELKTFTLKEDVYCIGDVVSGMITLQKDWRDAGIDEIKVHFRGISQVTWRTEKSWLAQMCPCLTYYDPKRFNQETIFDHKITIYKNGLSEFPGGNLFEFFYQLPNGIPTSYKDDIGLVQYSVRAEFSFRGLYVKQYSLWVPFKVNFPVKLQPIHHPPVTENKRCLEKSSSGYVDIKISLPNNGVITGRSINPRLKLNNCSSKDLSSVSLMLIKVAKYQNIEGCAMSREVIICNKNIDGRVPAGWSKTITTGAILKIPQLANLSSCNTIILDYFLKMQFSPSSFFSDNSVQLRLLIGTQTVSQVVSTQENHYQLDIIDDFESQQQDFDEPSCSTQAKTHSSFEFPNFTEISLLDDNKQCESDFNHL